jgi:hypothetical protein
LSDDEKRAELRRRNYLKPSEAAILIRRDKSTITRWIHKGLPVIHVGRLRFVETTELLRWAADDERRTRRRTSASQ